MQSDTSATQAVTSSSSRATASCIGECNQGATGTADGDEDGVMFVKDVPAQSQSWSQVMKHLGLRRHAVRGDGSCMHHAVAHQAGLIEATGHGDVSVSAQLRQLAVVAMRQHPGIREEDGLNLAQWQAKEALIQYPAHWGGDLELRVLALGLGKGIIVLSGGGENTASASVSSAATSFANDERRYFSFIGH